MLPRPTVARVAELRERYGKRTAQHGSSPTTTPTTAPAFDEDTAVGVLHGPAKPSPSVRPLATLTSPVSPVRSPAKPSSPTSFGHTFFAVLSSAWSNVRCPDGNSRASAEFDFDSFTAACFKLAEIYDRLGSFLAPAKKDMVSNLTNVTAGVASRRATAAMRTVQDVCRYDVQHGLTFGQTRDRKGIAFGLLWLVRALRFIIFLLANLDPHNEAFGDKELKHCATDAYARSIKPFHGRLFSAMFGAMMGQTPTRKRFLVEVARGDVETARAEQPGGGRGAATSDAFSLGDHRTPPQPPLPARAGSMMDLAAGDRASSVGSSGSARLVLHRRAASCSEVGDAAVYAEMRAFLAIATPVVDALHQFLVESGLDDPWKA